MTAVASEAIITPEATRIFVSRLTLPVTDGCTSECEWDWLGLGGVGRAAGLCLLDGDSEHASNSLLSLICSGWSHALVAVTPWRASVELDAAAVLASLTGAMNRYPRRGSVSINLGPSAESFNASRRRLMALLSPWSKSTKVSAGQRVCRSCSRVTT